MSIHLILLLGFILLVGIAAILITMFRCGFLKCLFFSAISGVGALLVLHFTSLMSGIALSLTPVSLVSGAVGGLPAVAGMLVLKYLVF